LKVKFEHNFREANLVAHELARLARGSDQQVWLDEPPFLERQYKRRCSHTRAYTHPYERTHYPYEHLRKTEPADWILKLTKSPQMSRYRRERRVPLNEKIPPL
jgi:hypothetical protein